MAAFIKNIVEKWVALYVRLSRDDENEGDSNSIAHQIEILTRYAKDNGITNYKIYKDDGYSGTNFKRPGFQEMLADIEAGLVSMVIVKDMSRFGRNYLEVGLYTEIRFPEMGVRFVAVNDGVDSENQMDNDFTGRSFFAMIMSVESAVQFLLQPPKPAVWSLTQDRRSAL